MCKQADRRSWMVSADLAANRLNRLPNPDPFGHIFSPVKASVSFWLSLRCL
jgi:hypothetical protein